MTGVDWESSGKLANPGYPENDCLQEVAYYSG